MARKKTHEAESSMPSKCRFCHHENKLQRYVHYLKFPDTGSLVSHLIEHHGESVKTDGFAASIERFWYSIHRQYKNSVDSLGYPIPAWRAWLQHLGVKILVGRGQESNTDL